MAGKHVHKMMRQELIEEINVLGPWVHGYFDLGNGLIIEDQDLLQKRRLLCYREYFIDIIRNYYGKETLNKKTLCDIGCNTGYFLYELFKKFKFKEVTGLEPRRSNLAKARFIARYFALSPDKYKLKRFDILTRNYNLPSYDIVIMPSVLHHISDHFHALTNAYRMTRDLFILDCLVLPNELNTPCIAEKLELKDDVYKGLDGNFGIIGYKIESNSLDGSAYHAGMVGLPTMEALVMMLKQVGFSQIQICHDYNQLKKEVYNGNLNRDIYAVIITAQKVTNQKSSLNYDSIIKKTQKRDFNTYIPLQIIHPLYRCVADENVEKTEEQLGKLIANRKYYPIIETFKYASQHKIPFEYAKTCYHKGLLEEAEYISQKLIKILNLDWRVVYKTYHLLALLNFRKGNRSATLKYNKLSLHAYESYYPALELKKQLNNCSGRTKKAKANRRKSACI